MEIMRSDVNLSPQIAQANVRILFTLHIDPRSVDKLKIPIAWADVVIVELAVNALGKMGGTGKWLADAAEEYLNHVAQGTIAPSDEITDIVSSEFKPYNIALCKALYRCGKQVYVERSPLHVVEPEEDKLRLTFHLSDPRWFDDLLRQFKVRGVKDHEESACRDNAFALLVSEKVRKHPGQNILVIRGSAHRHTLPTRLDKLGVKCDVQLVGIQPFADEIQRKLVSGQQPTQADLMRALAEYLEMDRLKTNLATRWSQMQIASTRIKNMTKEELRSSLKKELQSRSLPIH
jgi:hypothetical protein